MDSVGRHHLVWELSRGWDPDPGQALAFTQGKHLYLSSNELSELGERLQIRHGCTWAWLDPLGKEMERDGR
jgi:hypothetical protein